MKTKMSLCYTFYRNPGMLAEQYRVWAAYPDELKACIEVVLCDDGSPEPAVDVPRPAGLPPLRIYRIDPDRPWNQHSARNVAAEEAGGKWLFMSDMDHVLPEEGLRQLLELKDEGKVYQFRRLDAPHNRPKVYDNGEPHPHPNTFALTRDLYKRVGGYDDRLSGVYGTDSVFRRCSQALAGPWVKTEIPIVRYDRAVIADASTHTLDRDAYRNKELKRHIINVLLSGERPRTLTQEYRRAL